LPAGWVLHADRVAFRLVDTAGDTVYRGTGQNWDLRAAGDGTASGLQVIDLPKDVYARSVDRRVAIEIEYSLTLLKPRVLAALPALDGNELLPGLGRCVSRLDDDGAGFQVGCDAAGQLPPCLSVSLRRETADQSGVETFVCDLDYAPPAWRFSVEPIEQFVMKLAIEDRTHGTPPRGPQSGMQGVAVVFRLYAAAAHFSRHVVVAQIPARDVAAEPSPP
jgi:hypothetical protein